MEFFSRPYLLIYFDGNDTNPTTFQAGWSLGPPLGSPTFAFTLGAPGHKEEYEYTSPSKPGGKSKLTLIFDADDNLIGLSCRPLFIDNNTGSFWGGVGAVSLEEVFQDNGDGTYTIQLTVNGSTVVFEDFQRKNHDGKFTITDPDETGTYNCLKLN